MDELTIRISVAGEEAAGALRELAGDLRELGELDAGTGRLGGVVEGGMPPKPPDVLPLEELVELARDQAATARLIAERIDQQRRAIEALARALM